LGTIQLRKHAGRSLTGQKKFQEAEPFVVDGYNAMIQRKATIPARSSSALDDAGKRIVQLYGGERLKGSRMDEDARACDGERRSIKP
jgi:hypothetical protein